MSVIQERPYIDIYLLRLNRETIDLDSDASKAGRAAQYQET